MDDPTHPGSWLGAESASPPNAKRAEAGPCCGLDGSADLNVRNEFGIDLELSKACAAHCVSLRRSERRRFLGVLKQDCASFTFL